MALELDSSFEMAQIMRGATWYKLGNKSKAKECFEDDDILYDAREELEFALDEVSDERDIYESVFYGEPEIMSQIVADIVEIFDELNL